MPPQAVEIEKAVLGAMLIDLGATKKARVLLEAGDFYDQRHERVFTACCECYEYEGEVDQLIVADYMTGTGELDQAGGIVYLAELAAEVSTSANLSYHAAIIKRKAAARRGIEAASALTQRLYDDDGHDPDPILQGHTEDAGKIASGVSVAGLPMPTVLDATKADYEAAADRYKRGIPYAGKDTGFEEVNTLLNGLCPEEMTVIAARPSIGKTTLAWQMGIHIATNGGRVAGISLEMSRRQVGALLLRLHANLSPGGLRRGNLSEADLDRMRASDVAMRGLPLTVVDEVPMSIDQIRATILAIEAMGHVDLWIIDYLQLVTNDASDGELDVITRVLKTLTLELNTHILLVSQLNRDCERRTDKRPSLADLRGSGGIEQNANNVILVHRPGFYPELVRECARRAKADLDKDADAEVQRIKSTVTLIATKTRNGPTGETQSICWNPEAARFDEKIFPSTVHPQDIPF